MTGEDVLLFTVAVIGGALLLGVVGVLEAALVVANRLKIRGKARESTDPEDLIEISRDPDRYLTASIVASNLVAVFTLTFAVVFGFSRGLGLPGQALLVGIGALANAILGEILLRQAARPYAILALVRLGPILHAIEPLFLPFRLIVGAFRRWLGRHHRSEDGGVGVASGLDELRLALEVAYQQGLIGPEETFMVQGALALGRRRVADVMTPRSRIIVAPVDASPAQVAQRIVASGFSRLPVVDAHGMPLGIVHANDVLVALTRKASTMKADLKSLPVVSPAMGLTQLLRDFQSTGTQMALARVEGQPIVGLVTIEDVLEEIVGEIEDEFDPKGQWRGAAVVRGMGL